MNIVTGLPVSTDQGGVVIDDDISGFASIRRADCPAVLWQRSIDPGFTTWINGLPVDSLPRIRTVLRPGDVTARLISLCETIGLRASEERFWLINDVAQIAEKFAKTMEAEFIRLRMDVVDTNACRKFHIDYLTARLVCTYRGTGTQFGVSETGDDPTVISTVATGVPIVMRGKKWPVEPDRHFVHRSPPIEGTGETRLVVVLDPADRGEYEAQDP